MVLAKQSQNTGDGQMNVFVPEMIQIVFFTCGGSSIIILLYPRRHRGNWSGRDKVKIWQELARRLRSPPPSPTLQLYRPWVSGSEDGIVLIYSFEFSKRKRTCMQEIVI